MSICLFVLHQLQYRQVRYYDDKHVVSPFVFISYIPIADVLAFDPRSVL